MLKKILSVGVLTFVCLIACTKESQASKWLRGRKIQADSIVALIERGDDVLIDSCQILGSLMKRGTPEIPDTIKNLLVIERSIMYDTVSFAYCHFVKEAGFEWSVFRQPVDFSGATFANGAYFKGSCFKEFANFGQSAISKNADFSWATFSGRADFRGTTFREFVHFRGTVFRGCADLWYTTFRGRVDLTPTDFKNVRITWKRLQGHLFHDPPAHLKLMKHFEEERQLDDADGVYLFLRDLERMTKPWLSRYFEYWFIQLTCGYGVKPWRIFYWCIGIILLFMVFYTKSNAIKEIEKEFGHPRRRRIRRSICTNVKKKWYNALYFSVQTFIIGVVPDWHPTDEFLINTRKVKLFKFRTLSMIEGALGWVLLVLFVVTLTRKFIR